MFDLNTFSTSKGTPSGLSGYAIKAIRTLLTKLLHSPETGVVKLTVEDNTASVPYAHLVAISDAAPYTCGLTINDNLGNAVAVSLSRTTLAENRQGYFRMTGVADVAIEVGLILTNGERIYSSAAVNGQATTEAGPRCVGWILDHSNYNTITGGTALVLLEFDTSVGVQ